MHPKFDPIGVRTHEPPVHDSTFHVTETPQANNIHSIMVIHVYYTSVQPTYCQGW